MSDREWMEAYKADHRDILEREPGFADWLASEYVPIAGGWQY